MDKRQRVVAGKTLAEWEEFSRRDDCLDIMVPSDLRCLVQAAIAALEPVTVQEAARVLLDQWLEGAFEDSADAAADDASGELRSADVYRIIEAWLRALAEKGT